MARPTIIDDKFLDGVAEQLLTWIGEEGNYFLKDFAHTIISPATNKPMRWRSILNHAENHKGLRESIDIAKEMSESKIVKMGFEGKNQTFAIFTLKNISPEWREKQTIEHEGGVGITGIKFVEGPSEDGEEGTDGKS